MQKPDRVIHIEVANAVKPLINHGIFCGRERIGDVEDDVPEDCYDKYVVVRFRSGLMLNCRGDQVSTLRKGRE